MNVTLVEINIKPERVDEFLEVFRANHEGALQEPGNLRFDVLQDPEVKTRFFIYEAYKDDEAVLAHKKTPHYLACVEKLEEMMSQPRQKRSFIGLLRRCEGYPSPSQRERVKDTLLRFFDRNAQGRQRLARRLQHLFALLKGEGQRRFNADRLGVV